MIILSILSKMKIREREKHEDVVQLVMPLLDVVQCFANGSLSVENLGESQKANLQSKIKNREEIENFIQAFKNKERKIEYNLSYDNIIVDFIRDVNNLKFQHTSQKELLRKILHNIYDTISKLKNIQQNQTQELRNKIKDIFNKQLENIFLEKLSYYNDNQIRRIIEMISNKYNSLEEIQEVIKQMDEFKVEEQQDESVFNYGKIIQLTLALFSGFVIYKSFRKS